MPRVGELGRARARSVRRAGLPGAPRAERTTGASRCREMWEIDTVDDAQISDELTRVLITREQIDARMAELAAEIDRDYEGRELLLIGVLNGAVMVMADLSRALRSVIRMDWMAISSYGSGTQSSGVVR